MYPTAERRPRESDAAVPFIWLQPDEEGDG
jgi:hypothetical protein